MTLAALIAPLSGRRCAVAYRITEEGDKLPIDPRTGKACNAMDPGNWHDPVALHAAGWSVGLVLSPELGIFCIDLDDAWSDGQWSPFSAGMCAAFPGAAIEVSVSGKALHILASANLATVPAHRTSTGSVPGLEIYSRNRWIALTGNGLVGSILTDHTAMLQAAIATYLPGVPSLAGPSELWTTSAVLESPCAHLSDADLIRFALAFRPHTNTIFGGRASFRDVWAGDPVRMAMAWPTNAPGRQWDYNRADQALATHLAYFTGADCERTLRLMWGSGLVRDKWYAREDYMRRTVQRACRGKIESAEREGVSGALVAGERDGKNTSECAGSKAAAGSVLGQTATPVPPPPPTPPVVLAMDEAPAVDVVAPEAVAGRKPPGTYMTVYDQQELFEKFTWVQDVNQAITKEGELIDKQRFDVLYGGYRMQMTIEGTGDTKSAWEAFTQSQVHSFPKVRGTYFDPHGQTGDIKIDSGLTYVNSWVPITIDSRPGDVSLFLQHMCNIVPDERDRIILLSFMAFIVQHKGQRANWAPLLQGCPGNGKTFVSELMTYCVGQRYAHWPIADQLANHFNAAFYGKLLICVEDVKVTEDKASMWSALKPMITAERLQITPKGVDAVTREICFNMIFNANERDAVRKTKDDRRIAPFFCPQQHDHDLARYGMHEGSGYFKRLYGWCKDGGGYANIHHWLSRWKIPDEFHPLIMERRAPTTTSTEAAIRASRTVLEQEIIEAIEMKKPGFRNGWISSDALEFLLIQIGRLKQVSRNKREETVEDLGYQQHPGLATGRCLLSDGTKPTLYITRAGHETEQFTDWDQIAAAYQMAQR